MSGRSKQPQSRAQRKKEEARKRRKELKDEVHGAMYYLAGMRRRRGLNQAVVAKRMGVTQPLVSGLEESTDPRISTLAHYIEALGGQLQVHVRFPDQDKEVWLLPGIAE